MLYVSQKFSGKIKVTASKKLQLLKICVQKALLTLHNPVGYRATDIVGLSLYPSQTGLDILLTKISLPPSIPSPMECFHQFPPLSALPDLGIFFCVSECISLSHWSMFYLFPISSFQYINHILLGWFFFWIHIVPCAICFSSYLSGCLHFPELLLLSLLLP